MTEVRLSEQSTAHTPGPWSSEQFYYSSPSVLVYCNLDSKPYALAEAFGMHNLGEREANARLIAAAPDLLEACRNVREYLQAKGRRMPYLYEAIAKATGAK